MDMYGGNPPHFHLSGMRGTPRIHEWELACENYFYRGLMATIVVGKAFGDAATVGELHDFLEAYEKANGHNAPAARGA